MDPGGSAQTLKHTTTQKFIVALKGKADPQFRMGVLFQITSREARSSDSVIYSDKQRGTDT